MSDEIDKLEKKIIKLSSYLEDKLYPNFVGLYEALEQISDNISSVGSMADDIQSTGDSKKNGSDVSHDINLEIKNIQSVQEDIIHEQIQEAIKAYELLKDINLEEDLSCFPFSEWCKISDLEFYMKNNLFYETSRGVSEQYKAYLFINYIENLKINNNYSEYISTIRHFKDMDIDKLKELFNNKLKYYKDTEVFPNKFKALIVITELNNLISTTNNDLLNEKESLVIKNWFFEIFKEAVDNKKIISCIHDILINTSIKQDNDVKKLEEIFIKLNDKDDDYKQCALMLYDQLLERLSDIHKQNENKGYATAAAVTALKLDFIEKNIKPIRDNISLSFNLKIANKSNKVIKI